MFFFLHFQRRIAEQNRVVKRPRNEHVPYLTPGNHDIIVIVIVIAIAIIIAIVIVIEAFSGNPGNFEPLRDDDSEGPGMMIENHDNDGNDDGKYKDVMMISGAMHEV